MTEHRSPLDQVLDLVLYAPVGFVVTAGEELPRLIERGRAQMSGQVSVARLVGRFAVAQGQREAGKVVQQASTNDMVFDVATLVSIISEAMTLRSGDIIVTGTPSGVGASRKPQLWMRPGDLVEVEIEKIGCLSNPIIEEAAAEQRSAG